MKSETDLEALYDNRALVPEHVDILARWQTDAANYRAERSVQSASYGDKSRQSYDIMTAIDGHGADKPMILFIHGGYWRSLDRSYFSHLAAGLNILGFDVAMPSYSLCPSVRIADICAELEQCLAHLARNYNRPIVATGHSAGGHLAAWLCQEGLAKGLGARVSAGLGISGVYDLEPLLHVSMNNDLQLDEAQTRRSSPILCAPDPDIPFDSWVGASESSAFIKQSEYFAASWDSQGGQTTYIELAGCNHFTAIDPLANPDSLLTKRIASLAG